LFVRSKYKEEFLFIDFREVVFRWKIGRIRIKFRLEIGDWRLEIGDWRLEIGDWRLSKNNILI